MRNIVFNRSSDGHYFSFKDKYEKEYNFDYIPSIKGLWSTIDYSDFEVQLLIHPFLNRESNVFTLVSDIKREGETIGFIFPVSVLDSDNFPAKRDSDNNYLFVAYNVLLQRLEEMQPQWQSLGDCFEKNVCVCVLNLQTIGKQHGMWESIHKLRKLGYSFFIEDNRYNEIEKYTIEDYKGLIKSDKIHLKFAVPSLYADPIIDGLLRSLPKADNLVYRFILLYQIIEFLIARQTGNEIGEAIRIYQSSPTQSDNDFLESINNVRKERAIINEILNVAQISNSVDCYKLFNVKCQHLYALCGIVPQKADVGNLFYSFRNQMVHSYRHLNRFQEELADTVFYFEQVILTIVENYSVKE